jgi:hypothetical protein
MTDRFDRALRGLREQEDGANPRAEETLQRVLAERRMVGLSPWKRSVRLWLPIAAVLACSTAALAWMETFGARPAVLAGVDEATTSPRGVVPPGPSTGPTPALSAPSATGTSEPEAAEADPLPAPTPEPPRPVPTKRASSAAPASGSSAAVAAPAEPPRAPTVPAAPATESSEADVYAHAHRLHFDGGDAPAALSAWDEYLSRFPDGRFAPDARYNRAIDLLKLHRVAEARAALQSFADGGFGGYHGDDARKLLRSIP